MQRNLEEFQISNGVVDDLLATLEIFKEKNLAEAAKCTKKGFQTMNILNFETPKKLIKTLPYFTCI